MVDESESNARSRIAAVVVTFNRLALLQECLAALRGQTRAPDEIIVVDNSSTDGSGDWLDSQTGITVIRQPNSGSSGGQYTGIKAGYERGHDWIWCMDDDTIPEPNSLERLTASPHFADPEVGFLCSLLKWSDGCPHPNHEILPTSAADWCDRVLVDRGIRVRVHTFVSVLISRRAVAAVGLPVKEFFLIFDDYEYTDRIARRFPGWCVLDSWVVHKTKERNMANAPSPASFNKECYRIRNAVAWTLYGSRFTMWGKLQSLASLWANSSTACLKGRFDPRPFWWFFKGLFFRYRIDRVDAASQ